MTGGRGSSRTLIETALAVSTLCLLAVLCLGAPEPLHEQTFDNGTTGWEPFLGYWRLNDRQWHWSAEDGNPGGCMALESRLGAKKPDGGAHDALALLRARPVWKDYSYEADVLCKSGNAGLWFRARMRSSGSKDGRWVAGYIFMVDRRHRTARLWKHRQDGFYESGRWLPNHFSNPIEIKTVRIDEIPAGKWIRLKVTAVGPRIECFIDGGKVIDVEDDTYSYGSVGFAAYKASAQFDNVLVVPVPPIRGRK